MSGKGIGLRGKFLLALLIAAALPLLVGVTFLHTFGFDHLLAERGRAHAAEARHLAGSLEQAVEGQVLGLGSWVAADGSLLDLAARQNEEVAAWPPARLVADTAEVDAAWAGLDENAPRLRAVLDNPGAASLRAFCARHPLVAEVLATDVHGRAIASTRRTSDYDQADEAWWTVGNKLPPGASWSDELHLDESAGVYSLDMVLPLYRRERIVGVIKMVIDATPLFGEIAARRQDAAERLEIMLPDGGILARLGDGDYHSLSSRIDQDAMLHVLAGGNGWTVARADGGRMLGYAGIWPPGRAAPRDLPAGYVLISTRERAVVAPVRRQLAWVAAVAGLAVALCAVAGYKLVSRTILRPLKLLRSATRTISETARLRRKDQSAADDPDRARVTRARAERELDQIRSIHTGDEVETLAGDFAVMSSRVLRYHRELEAEVAAKTAVIRQDLEMARQFQNALMPVEHPDIPGPGVASALCLRFAHFYQPAATLGGDFFDIVRLDECRVAVLVGDVMGHGARSALVTAIVHSVARHRVTAMNRPGDFLAQVNQHLHEVVSRSGQTIFVTALLTVFDTRDGSFEWAVAGHPAPLLGRRGSGRPPRLLWTEALRQPALGLVPGATYQTIRETLECGDVMLLFTDGVFEAEGPGGDEFGIDRLAASFGAALDRPFGGLPAAVVGEVDCHLAGRPNEDDVCLVAVEVAAGPGTG